MLDFMEVSITEAARHLNISTATVRRRLHTGAINGIRKPTAQGFIWIVRIEATPSEGIVGGNGLVELLKVQLQDLRDQLDTRTREISELHQLLAVRALGPGKPWWAFWR